MCILKNTAKDFYNQFLRLWSFFVSFASFQLLLWQPIDLRSVGSGQSGSLINPLLEIIEFYYAEIILNCVPNCFPNRWHVVVFLLLFGKRISRGTFLICKFSCKDFLTYSLDIFQDISFHTNFHSLVIQNNAILTAKSAERGRLSVVVRSQLNELSHRQMVSLDEADML